MMKIAFFMGRIIVGVFYLYNGLNHFMEFSDLTEYARMKGIPLAGLGVVVSGILLFIAALTIISGKFPELGVASLVLFFLPVTFMMHNFWAVTEEQKMMEMINFSKNLALMGSALMFLKIEKPWPFSLSGRKGV